MCLFILGTTNSGKSYTFQGTPVSPGIIPRGLKYIFNQVHPKATPCYKIVNCCDIISLTQQDGNLEIDLKMKILDNADKNQHIKTQMQQLFQEELSPQTSQGIDDNYTVWISFAEIYNEAIFDLLWQGNQQKRPELNLLVDKQGRPYIKGLTRVCVNSGTEAYKVLLAGQYNLKMAVTGSNSNSSRSHCVFTINLLKHTKENDPNSVNLST